jgi:hypothetical protein
MDEVNSDGQEMYDEGEVKEGLHELRVYSCSCGGQNLKYWIVRSDTAELWSRGNSRHQGGATRQRKMTALK